MFPFPPCIIIISLRAYLLEFLLYSTLYPYFNKRIQDISKGKPEMVLVSESTGTCWGHQIRSLKQTIHMLRHLKEKIKTGNMQEQKTHAIKERMISKSI